MTQNNQIHKPASFELESDKRIFDWRSYLYMLKRRKWLVILPIIAGVLCSFYMYIGTKPLYTSKATLLVTGGKLLTSSLKKFATGVTGGDEVDGVKNYMMSAHCIAGLISSLKMKMTSNIVMQARELAAGLPDMTEAEVASRLFIDSVREGIEVKPVGRGIIEISNTNITPKLAADVTSALTDIFIEEFKRRQVGGVRGAREFSEEQIDIYKEMLDESEARLKKFQEGELQNQMDDFSVSKQALERLRSDISAIGVSLNDKKARLTLITGQMQNSTTRPQKVSAAAVAGIRKKMFKSVDALINVLSQYSWTDPRVIDLNDDINRHRDAIRVGLVTYARKVFSEKSESERDLLVEWNLSQMDIEVLEYEKKALSGRLEGLEKNILQAPSRQMTLKNLQREVEQNRALYLQFVGQARGTKIEEQIYRRDAEFKLQLLGEAKQPLVASNTGLKQYVILAGLPLIGLLLGGGIIYALDFIDQSVKNVDLVEREFGLPVWGVIPEIELEVPGFWSTTGLTFLLATLLTGLGITIIYLAKRGGPGIFM